MQDNLVNNPKVSVAMGVYNGEKYLRQSIESILNQTYRNFEFIICDDCSTDNSVQIIKEYMKKDKRIVLLQNNKNNGLAYSLNRCIDIARGEYIARMDDDDISIKDRFKKQVEFLDTHREYEVVCSGMNMFDENGIWGIRIDNVPLTKENIYKINPIPHPTVMMRKKKIKDIGGYTVSKNTLRCEDYDLWCKLYLNGNKAYYLQEVLLNYRENNNSFKKRNYKSRIRTFRVKMEWRKKLELPYSYNIYAIKPLLVGLIPNYVIKNIHKNRFK